MSASCGVDRRPARLAPGEASASQSALPRPHGLRTSGNGRSGALGRRMGQPRRRRRHSVSPRCAGIRVLTVLLSTGGATAGGTARRRIGGNGAAGSAGGSVAAGVLVVSSAFSNPAVHQRGARGASRLGLGARSRHRGHRSRGRLFSPSFPRFLDFGLSLGIATPRCARPRSVSLVLTRMVRGAARRTTGAKARVANMIDWFRCSDRDVETRCKTRGAYIQHHRADIAA